MDSKTNEFETKYGSLINEKNFYRLLLSVRTDLRKYLKKGEINQYFSLIVWCMKILNTNNEVESCLSLLTTALEEYDNYFNKSDVDLFLESLKSSFMFIPANCDKSKLKHQILKFLESKHISEICLQKYGFYKIFALDSLNNKDTVDGYRYALKSQDYEVIDKYIQLFFDDKNAHQNEKNYFIVRVIFELILLKNLPLALKVISKYIDESNNYQNNHPILNFGFFLISVISNYSSDFDKFWTFINLYKPVIETDATLVKYLNKISLLYYNTPIIKEQSGMNIMNLLKAFTN
jgi:hypothetical protein